MVCVGLSERDLKKFGGARQKFWGAVAPPSSAPARKHSAFYCSKIQLFILISLLYLDSSIQSRTAARKLSIGGLWVYAGVLDTLKIGKISTD